MKYRTIAIANQKGGVGKTTTTANLGAALARAGKNVLMVDLDPQAHLTAGLGLVPDELEHTIMDVLFAGVDPTMAIQDKGEDGGLLHLLPSRLELAAAEMRLLGMPGREMILRGKLSHIKNEYHVILIDTPPSLGQLTLNGLCAADTVLVTCQPEPYALAGLRQLESTIGEIRERVNPQLEIGAVVPVMYDARLKIHQDMRENLRDHFGDRLLETVIRRNVALAEAQASGKHIYAYASGSNGAADYASLAEEVSGKL